MIKILPWPGGRQYKAGFDSRDIDSILARDESRDILKIPGFTGLIFHYIIFFSLISTIKKHVNF